MTGSNIIYAIYNAITGKVYVGKTTYGKRRWYTHKSHLRNNDNLPNKHLQSSWNKYGEKCFKWIVLEECCEEELDDREIYWISYFVSANRKFGYNKGPGGGKGNLGMKHTKETREKMSRKLKEHYRLNGYNRQAHSEETKQKMSRKKQKPVIRIADDGMEKRYSSALDAAQDVAPLKGCSSAIAKVIKGKRKQAYGYRWKYAD